MGSYELDSSLVDPTWEAVLLSERDVAGQIPINFVTQPAVSLTAACFGSNVFAKDSLTTCLSNLLTVGYRRFIVDLYWSADDEQWLLCPVSIPTEAEISSYLLTTSTLSSGTAMSVAAEVVTSTGTGTTTATATTTADSAQATITVVIDPDTSSEMYELGSYMCAKDLDLSTLLKIFASYYRKTASDLTAYVTYLVFNIHAASSAFHPDQPASAVSGSKLPSSKRHLSHMLNDDLGTYVYSPEMLGYDRSDLNGSWYRVSDENKPIIQYFTIDTDSDGIQSTPDGWPCEKYVQFAKERRLLAGFGSVDPQMQEYDLEDDADLIFPADYLSSNVAVSTSSNGTLQTGCFYSKGVTIVSQANSSWAETSHLTAFSNAISTDLLRGISQYVQELVSCGLSLLLNDTLLNKTADSGVDAYRNISFSSTWAWAIGEPRDAASPDNSIETKLDRCALMDLTLAGHWRSADCKEARYAACRVGNDPFTWNISTAKYPYANVSDACPLGSGFSVPRTGLENTYLYQYILSLSSDVIDPGSADMTKQGVWVDFNSLDVQSCWVSGGPNAECPYASNPQELERRTVLVATIAGIVICTIAALTLFVKCNTNRRNSRRTKRVIEGWEYEGVPS
ncbi:hypothetical protein ASPZODRAFT_151699 [Penicilliopsis zonata CBS 506.65]|uniref:Maintenance of telomere capping protein 6 n=1 Tax=Penicilliopsis zonata CBS 506.65 TaxID=1073090 RepID=A0A1L9SJD8_9EURO|nr:hypothetical protein ASPZODRAFT_151699 [Penicilliopsis zonata CBS 506.65]OJJ47154.1 hypothetical protein ASPZODRAFT_151699 [Penicilliopsis zonata CBS 506.65]